MTPGTPREPVVRGRTPDIIVRLVPTTLPLRPSDPAGACVVLVDSPGPLREVVQIGPLSGLT